MASSSSAVAASAISTSAKSASATPISVPTQSIQSLPFHFATVRDRKRWERLSPAQQVAVQCCKCGLSVPKGMSYSAYEFVCCSITCLKPLQEERRVSEIALQAKTTITYRQSDAGSGNAF